MPADEVALLYLKLIVYRYIINYYGAVTMKYNKGQIFIEISIIILIIGIAILGSGIVENKTAPNSDSQEAMIWRFIAPTPAYGHNIWPDDYSWGYMQQFYTPIPPVRENNIWPDPQGNIR
jgi:hypothetical protein